MKKLFLALLAAGLVATLGAPAQAAPAKRKVSVSVTDRSITVGEAIRVFGRVSPATSGKVLVQRRQGTGWQTRVKVSVSAGRFSWITKPRSTTRYRVVVPRSGRHAASASRTVTVRVTEPRARDLTNAKLRNARVPSLCGHPAGRLRNGTLPGIAPGRGEVTYVKAAFGEIDARAGRDAAAVVRCNKGGVGWPDQVVVYTADAQGRPVVRGRFDSASVVRFGRETVRNITLTGRTARVNIHAGESYECMACGTVSAWADLRLVRGKVAVRLAGRYGAREALAAFLAAASRGDRAAALRLSERSEHYEHPADVAIREAREGGALTPARVYGPAPLAACDQSFSTGGTRDCRASNAAHDFALVLRNRGWRDWRVTWMIRD